ncbi:MAG: fructosamine kinase family protein [Flavobacteriaceae bacterium]|nr:fructosamine kinase family protein [Flavobacteriaceae bacterium]
MSRITGNSQNKDYKNRTPNVLHFGTLERNSCLALEWIDTKPASPEHHEFLGIQLAELHHFSQEQFGYSCHNIIGHLPQSNNYHNNWGDFYINERLIPQLHLAKINNFINDKTFISAEKIKEKCNTLDAAWRPMER